MQIQIDTSIIMPLCLLVFICLPPLHLLFILILAALVDLFFFILRKLNLLIDRIFEIIVYLLNNKYFMLCTMLYICYLFVFVLGF
jgi:hypothetical protein